MQRGIFCQEASFTVKFAERRTWLCQSQKQRAGANRDLPRKNVRVEPASVLAEGASWSSRCTALLHPVVKALMTLAIIGTLWVGCSSTRSGGLGVIGAGSRTVHLASDRELDDWEIHNAITRVIDRGDDKFTQADGLILRYHDDWSFDIVMFLCELQIRISDRSTGEVLATSSWSQGRVFHMFPNSSNVVANMLDDLDAKGVFRD